MSYTVKQIVKATPCMPDHAIIPTSSNKNIAPQLWRINKGAETLNPRRNYWNPFMYAIGSAQDTKGVTEQYKIECGKFLKRYADILRNKHLPLLSVYGVESNINDELGFFYEHSFPDFWVLYAKLYDESFAEVVQDHTRWLIRHQESGGLWKNNIDWDYSFRADVRRFFELVCMSETDLNATSNRAKCAAYATRFLDRIAGLKSTGGLEGLGWDEKTNILYYHYSASKQRGERVDHTYFTAIFSDLMIRYKHSKHYQKNKALADSALSLLIASIETIVSKTSETWDVQGNRTTTGHHTNIRHSELGLDTGKNGKYRSFSTDDGGKGKAGWPAYRFWLLCDNMSDFKATIANTAVANIPGLMHYPEVITAYTDIMVNTKQPPIKPNPNNEINVLLNKIELDTLRAAQYTGRARRNIKALKRLMK